MVDRYGAGVRVGADEVQARDSLQSLFGRPQAWTAAASGARRMCLEEFDLDRNVATFAGMLCRAAEACG